jgi:hypothetical protein
MKPEPKPATKALKKTAYTNLHSRPAFGQVRFFLVPLVIPPLTTLSQQREQPLFCPPDGRLLT